MKKRLCFTVVFASNDDKQLAELSFFSRKRPRDCLTNARVYIYNVKDNQIKRLP